jgi:C4-dicarboxylate-specific signal transduction histidine kinase
MEPTSRAALHRRLQEILLQFSRGTAPLAVALEGLSRNANELFGTRRASVWLHDRREWAVVLTASSDRAYAASAARIPTSDSSAPPARGLRLERAQLVIEDRTPVMLAPLRGWRRALGTLVIEGPPAGFDDEQYVDAADELARQLAVAIENVQLLEEIMRQRRLLEDTFNSLADLVVVTDNALRVVQTNEVFAARIDTPRAALVERPLTDLVGRHMAAWVQEPAPRAEDGTAAAGGVVRTQRFDDERLRGTFAVTMTPLINRDGDPVGRVLVARDITAQTRLEAEQAALRQRLAQTEKLASLGQFVAGIAHEMNNALQGVLGHLELLLGTSDAARPIRRELRRIYKEGDRAAKIVQNLLVFTGSGRMSRQVLNVEEVVSRALTSRRAAFRRRRIDVSREQGAGVPPIVGDALLLHQALLNVLINAEHALNISGPGARRLDVSTTAGERGQAVITIRDSGPGIPLHVLPRIFDPFFTTRDVGQGTGLGLAITYGIVQEHGGAIHASNVADGGAKFVIELPGA